MKIRAIKTIKSETPVMVADCFIDSGYLQGQGGALPDVDVDYQSDRRAEVKEYIERKYNKEGKQVVFSAGTLTTLKVKAVIKDVARTQKIPVHLVNYLTAMFEDDKCDYTGIFKLASTNKKIAKFIADYPTLFEDIRTLMFQPRSASIHASALLVTPDEKDGESVECFDFVPIKKVDGVLVSENDGYELDELGLLKNDCLSTKELSKIQAILNICNREYNENLTLESLATGKLDLCSAYNLLAQGYTQNVFQFSSRGMTKFLMEMQPACINDLIAANALYRPATLENGAAQSYIDCKKQLVQPVYLWGTYNALKDTYGLITYQEQVVLIAREVGGFSLGDGVNLVKFISKKKIEKIQAMKGQFFEGAKERGCPIEDIEAIWEQIEACGSYLFNKSHATAYAVTSYVGAYLKAMYPTAFYTVGLEWADDKELVVLMSEMEACSKAKVVAPCINKSKTKFYTDYSTDRIFWSLSRISQLGVKAVEWIMNERERNGDFESIENFIERIFKYKLKIYKYWDDPDNEDEIQRCPVNARSVKHLILAGCFDLVEGINDITERYNILQRAKERLGIKAPDKDIPKDMIDKHYFWSQQQVKVSGIGSIDYRKIYDESKSKPLIRGRASYCSLSDILSFDKDGKNVAVCVTVADVEERSYTNSKTGDSMLFCKLTVQQNNETNECILWSEEYEKMKEKVKTAKGKIAVISAQVRYSDYSGKNTLQCSRKSIIEIL